MYYAFEFVSDDGGYLGFCCDKGSFGNDSKESKSQKGGLVNETKSLSKYQKFFHLFNTLPATVLNLSIVFLVLIRVFGNRIVDKSFSYLKYDIREAICLR